MLAWSVISCPPRKLLSESEVGENVIAMDVSKHATPLASRAQVFCVFNSQGSAPLCMPSLKS
jgi:hypothetical protein